MHVTVAVAHRDSAAALDHADSDFVIVDARGVRVDAGKPAATGAVRVTVRVPFVVPVVVRRWSLMGVYPKQRIDDKRFCGERGI